MKIRIELAVAEAIQLLEQARLLVSKSGAGDRSYVGLTRLGEARARDRHGASASRTQRRATDGFKLTFSN